MHVVFQSVSSAYCNMVFRDDIHLFFTRNAMLEIVEYMQL